MPAAAFLSHPAGTLGLVVVREPQPWSPRFSATARAIAAECRALGLAVPGFRSPPAVAGVDRTLRRWPDGRSVVAVRAAGRPAEAVVRDLVEGVIAANRLEGGEAERVRRALTEAAVAAGSGGGAKTGTGSASPGGTAAPGGAVAVVAHPAA